jgi:hypothetical protein
VQERELKDNKFEENSPIRPNFEHNIRINQGCPQSSQQIKILYEAAIFYSHPHFILLRHVIDWNFHYEQRHYTNSSVYTNNGFVTTATTNWKSCFPTSNPHN